MASTPLIPALERESRHTADRRCVAQNTTKTAEAIVPRLAFPFVTSIACSLPPMVDSGTLDPIEGILQGDLGFRISDRSVLNVCESSDATVIGAQLYLEANAWPRECGIQVQSELPPARTDHDAFCTSIEESTPWMACGTEATDTGTPDRHPDPSAAAGQFLVAWLEPTHPSGWSLESAEATIWTCTGSQRDGTLQYRPIHIGGELGLVELHGRMAVVDVDLPLSVGTARIPWCSSQ